MEPSSRQVTEAFVYIRRLVQATVPHPDCEDVASDAFLGWWEGVSKQTFRKEANLNTYAYSIARNKITDWMRRKYQMARGNWHNTLAYRDYVFEQKFGVTPHEKVFETDELFKKFMEGAHVCTPRQEEAVRLRFEYDMTHKEGGKAMGISKRMFAAHLHQGMRKMIVRFCDEVRDNKNVRRG